MKLMTSKRMRLSAVVVLDVDKDGCVDLSFSNTVIAASLLLDMM